MYVWLDHNGKLNVALDKNLAPSNATFIDTSSYTSVPPIDALVSVSNGQIVVNSPSQVLQNLKQKAIKDLSQKTTEYILKHYPEAKQRADMSNLTNGETYLASQGIDITALRKAIGNALLNGTDFRTALANLNTTYNTSSSTNSSSTTNSSTTNSSTTNSSTTSSTTTSGTNSSSTTSSSTTSSNATISYWLGQVLKASYRQYFVYQVKQEYYTYLQEIQQATSLPLPSFEFKTPFPTLG
jgi:hypothetical protein